MKPHFGFLSGMDRYLCIGTLYYINVYDLQTDLGPLNPQFIFKHTLPPPCDQLHPIYHQYSLISIKLSDSLTLIYYHLYFAICAFRESQMIGIECEGFSIKEVVKHVDLISGACPR
jgi:hypothetical protein